jgi:flagellar basal-body rod protein FlgC
MGIENLFGASAISGSGMSAERYRMEVIANNIANANTTKGKDGKPFQREAVVFAAVLDEVMGGKVHATGLKGVEVVGRVTDESPYIEVHMPGHPDADANGIVKMPNVKLSIEMVDLLTAQRAYEANVRAATTFRQMNETALNLLRG